MTTVLPTPTVGPYRMIRPLGAGGMGEVFLAHDAKLGRDIALKVLPSALANDASLLARLRQEARAASSLNHPNIVTIYDIGEIDGGAYIAMEHIEGRTLREMLAAGALPVRKALQIVVQIAEGLAAAHKRGLVHRDLKPENVMVTSDGVVKILDFGLAKQERQEEDQHDSRNRLTGIRSDPGSVVGTYGYMAPEQAKGERVDYRADQFALGAILYELVSAKRAFEGASGIETLFMIVRDEPEPLGNIVSVPAPYRWIVDRCLAKDPDERYVSTIDLARDLRQLGNHFNESMLSNPSAKPVEGKATRKRTSWLQIALVAVIAAAGTAAALSFKKEEPPMLRSERYLTYSGFDYSPAVSPDGKLIAFSSLRDGKQRIWLKQVDGGGEVALTEGADDFPRFSPDGASVIFSRADPNRTGASIYRVATVGGEARRIVPNAGSGDFSPDGSKLAYSVNAAQATPVGRIFVAAADGSGGKEVGKLDNYQLIQPRWSPDGKKIAAVSLRARVAQSIAIVDVASGKVKLLAFPPKSGEVSSAVWTEDSEAVIYLRSESVEAVVGSTAKIVRHDIHSDSPENIGWSSHNGNVLDVLGVGRLVTDVRSPRDNMRAVAVTGPDAKTPLTDKWITRGNSSDRQPAYSPDGKSLLFTSNRSGNLDLWMVDLASGGVRRVTDDAAEDWDPGFTPDGKVVWSSGRSGNLEIWIANADGTDARQISQDGFDAENPSATPDGWIVYNSFNERKTGLWKVRYDGSQPAHIVRGRTAVPEVSPDGRYVAYLVNPRTGASEVRVARVADGKDMGVGIHIRGTRRTNAILGRVRWMPDSKALAFLAQDAEGRNGVFVQDFVPGVDTTKTKRPLAGFDPDRSTESFGIAPDAQSVALAEWEQLFSIFAIDGVPGVARMKEASNLEG